MKVPHALLRIIVLFLAALPAQAVTLRVSAPALERTLRNQLFTTPGPDGKLSRHYLRGNPQQPCSVYLDEPHLTFLHPVTSIGVAANTATDAATAFTEPDRIVVSVKTHARFGKAVKGFCLGIPISLESQVSFIPEAEGESIGFHDARIDHISNNAELNALLVPFLSHRLPAEMKINAANLMRTLLVRAPDQTGYTLTLKSLQLHSMSLAPAPADNPSQPTVLLIDLDAEIQVD